MQKINWASQKKKRAQEEPFAGCEESFPDSEYPSPPVLEAMCRRSRDTRRG
jgi:hypothetical protein